MVVDDGSTDGTAALVSGWKKEGSILIEYIYQENSGKMRALNLGVRVCGTPFFFCVDSDDYLADGAIAQILTHTYSVLERPDLCGMMGRKRLLNRYRFSAHFPAIETSTTKDLFKSGFLGDVARVFKTEVIRRFPLAEIEGEKFIPESYSYDQIDKEYRFLLVDELWTICEYQEDGYSANRLRLKKENPKSFALLYLHKIKDKDGSWIMRLKYLGHYLCFSQQAGYSFRKTLTDSGSPLACTLCWPLGVMYRLRLLAKYRIRYGKNG